jgi:hypothetical protein
MQFSHEKAEKHRLAAENEAIRLPKRRKVPRNPEEVYVTQQQIQAMIEGVDTVVAEDLEIEEANNAQVERFILEVAQQDEGSL